LTVELDAGGRRRAVEARQVGDGWAVFVDGFAVRVDATRVAERWSLLIGSGEAQSGSTPLARQAVRSYEVTIEEHEPGELVVFVNGIGVPVSIPHLKRGRFLRSNAVTPGVGPEQVAAPMPGRVVRVLVKPGDAVQAGQALVVVEAMKMENELRSSRAGTVTDVRAVEGMLVEAKSVLVVVE